MKSVLKRLDSIHEKLLATVALVEADLFNRRPAENEWSVAEIIDHLCLVEERVIKDLGKALKQEPRQLRFLRRLVPTSIVALRLVRVKSPKAVVPTNPAEKETAIRAYNSAREKLKELCAAHGKERLLRTTFKHPFLGEISGMATVSFVGYHEQRHFKQIRDVLKKLGRQD